MRLLLAGDTGYAQGLVALRPVQVTYYEVITKRDVISDARELVLEQPCGCG
ncbi:MAG TPA: hypothetical protein VE288_10165 [Rubrobacteraceae bacterium]|nr:hypothetical protein [Rubrobacteraceae bacterium]